MITNNVLYEKFTGDGSASTFTLTSLEYLHDGANLKIARYDSSLALSVAEVVLEYGTHYTVDTANNTITIIDDPNPDVTVPYASTVTLTVTTNLDYTQGIDITSNSNYDPEVLESGYDKSVILAKQNKESIDRTIKVSQTDTGANLKIPPLEGSSGGYIYITNDGGSPPNYSLETHPGPVPKIWDPLYEYQVGDITQESGDMWICKTVDTGTQPGTDTSIWEIYVDRFSEWNANIKYALNAGVWHNGLLYTSKVADNLGNTPGTDTNWEELNIYGTRWNINVSYLTNDVTSYNGVLIRAKQNNKGQTPNITPGQETVYWEVLKTGGSVEVEGESGSDSLAVNKLVYFDDGQELSTDAGKVLLGDNRYVRKSFLTGFVNNISGTVITIQSGGLIDGFTGLTEGKTYYLGHDGNIVLRSAIDSSEYIVPVGVAKNATTIAINISFPEPTRNQDDGTPIGAIVQFATYKERSAFGYIPFALNNAVSQANFPILFAEVGHKFNEQHVDAGDTDLSGSSTLFYPTPIPGAYNRCGVPDSTIIDSTNDIDSNIITMSATDVSSLKVTRATGRDGVPVQVKLVSGSLPSGLSALTIYYVRFLSATTISLYDTEAHAIDTSGTTGIIALTDATGTFKITQEGIAFDDAFQGHEHLINVNDDTTPSGTGAILPRDINPVTTSVGTDGMLVNGVDGTPRTTNETRPKTNITFSYIKAENVMTSGEPLSALRDEQDWVEFTGDWRNKEFIITPSPSIGYNSIDDIYNLNVEIWLADDAFGANACLVKNIARVYENSDDVTRDYLYGLSIMPNSIADFKLQTGNAGINYIGTSGNVKTLGASNTGAYKVIITKPNLITTTFDVSGMPKVIDLTSADYTYTLPAITGAPQKKSVYWKNGGTYKLTIKDDDGNTLDYNGEGDGHAVFESDGTNWQVLEYEDSGSNSNGEWYKEKSGELSMTIYDSFPSGSSITVSIGDGHYRADNVALLFPHSTIDTNYSIVGSIYRHYSVGFTVQGTTSFVRTIYNTSSISSTFETCSIHIHIKARWRA